MWVIADRAIGQLMWVIADRVHYRAANVGYC